MVVKLYDYNIRNSFIRKLLFVITFKEYLKKAVEYTVPNSFLCQVPQGGA